MAMTLTDKIREAQTDIIMRLAACEEAIAALYAFFGHHIPSEKHFWIRLAKEEQSHAIYLKTLLNLMESVHFFKNIGRFDVAAIQTLIDTTTTFISKFPGKNITAQEATSLALRIESSLLESDFYAIVKTDAPGYQTIAKALATATRHHIETIQNRMIVLYNQSSGKSAEKR